MAASVSENHVCSHRHSCALDNFFRKLIQSPHRILSPFLSNGDTAIDLGCGPGFFTLPMAELVGHSGTVIGVDVQPEMLARVKAKLAKMRDRSSLAQVLLHQSSQADLGLDHSIRADFILAYYMVHETPDQHSFFRQVKKLLKPTGRLLIVEPPFPVSRKQFAQTLRYAAQ
ncbi:MAG: class I SAM-dependent methyltransferase, partial [Desulfofustis sp.]|nr:class I SAM-dependent methyltransferase [Desulfofustis sp.]